MALFSYGLRCIVCGKLDAKFTGERFARRASVTHQETYADVFADERHIVSVIDLTTPTYGPSLVVSPR